MAKILIYTKDNCSYCHAAKKFLTSKNLPFEEIRVDHDEKKRDEMVQLSKRRTVPQIFINDQPIGGYDELMSLVKTGQFENLLKS